MAFQPEIGQPEIGQPEKGPPEKGPPEKGPPHTERRALDVFEALLDQGDDPDARARLLDAESEAVRTRVLALERRHAGVQMLRTGAPLGTLAAIAVPDRVGAYRPIRLIGRGGMGEVWLAQRDDGLFDRQVAIKFLRLALNEAASRAFAAERRILARLDHPGIVHLIDGGVTQDGLPYLVMDHVDGLPIDEAWGAMPLSRRIALVEEIARAVQFAHGRLIVHGDLKPANILIDGEGRVRLLDFGIARLLTAEADDPARGAMTPGFASPERLAGEPASIADDVHALGLIVQLAADGARDADLAAIIARAIHADPARRYATAHDLAQDLDRWRRGLPVTARPDRMAYRLRKFVARHRLGTALAMAGVLALAVATGQAIRSDMAARRDRAEAEARFADARGAAHYLVFTLEDRLETMPHSLQLRREAAGVAQRYLTRLAQSTLASGPAPPDLRPADLRPADLRIETAQGFLRLAEAEGVPGHLNFDRPDLARRDLDRALTLLSGNPDPAAADLAVRALTERAHLRDYSENRNDLALADLDAALAIVRRHPHGDPTVRIKLLAERADALSWRADWAGTEAAAAAALAALGTDQGLDASLTRAALFEAQANALDGRGDHAGSVRRLRDSVAQLADAARRFPQSRRAFRQLSRGRWMLGSAMLDHPGPEPLALLGAAQTGLEQIARDDTDDTDVPRLVRYVESDRARMLAVLGRAAEAEAIMTRLLDGDRAQWRRHPQESQWLRDLVIDLAVAAHIETGHGQIATGCAHLAEFDSDMAALSRIADPAALSLGETERPAQADKRKFCR